MRKMFLAIFVLVSTQIYAMTPAEKAEIILEEYYRLRLEVQTIVPDYKIANYHNVKEYGDHSLIWTLEENKSYHEVIRLFKKDENTKRIFAITYHRSPLIIPGKIILRRFFGPEPYGFRNDSADLETGEFIGSQGMTMPHLEKEDLHIFEQWRLTPFFD